MNLIIPCLIKALKRSVNRKLREKTKQTTNQQKKHLLAKFEHLSLNAPVNNVQIQSYKSLTPQVFILVITKQMGLYIIETR